ncbi:unnamed protein product, partial [Urochloa humidicola]
HISPVSSRVATQVAKSPPTCTCRHSHFLEHLVSREHRGGPGSRARARAGRVMEESGVRAAAVRRLMAAKAESGKSFSDVAAETGLTNVYVAQLLRRQAQLKPDTAPKLRAALPALTDDLVDLMMQPPFRSYHPDIAHEPAIYRLNEAVMHFGESIKEIINEEFGDGIMSAIDFYCSVDKVQGADGKDRVVVTFDGKYLPYTEQKSEHMMSRPASKTS